MAVQFTRPDDYGRNYLGHEQGDAIDAVLAAAGYTFRLWPAAGSVDRHLS